MHTKCSTYVDAFIKENRKLGARERETGGREGSPTHAALSISGKNKEK